MARNWFVKAAAVTLSLALLAGCGGAKKEEPKTPSTQPPAATEKKTLTVGMVTDMGGLNDDSFNAAAFRGLTKLETQDKFKKNVVESKRQEDYETNLQTMVDQKNDLIWGIGALMGDAVTKIADKNKNQHFAIIDGVVEKPNVASVVFKEEEGSFLMGIMAAKTTKSKKVGFVGGMDIDVIHHFDAGFKAGVKAIDPTVEVVTVYSGSFTDPSKGKSDTLTMIGKGVDVVFHASGGTGQGVIEAAKEKNIFAIGVDSDQNHLAKDTVISSMMKMVDVAVYDVSKQAAEGTFPGGKVITLGIKENGIGYSSTTLWNKMPEGTKALVDKWSDAIKAGKVTPPRNAEQLKDWKVPTL